MEKRERIKKPPTDIKYVYGTKRKKRRGREGGGREREREGIEKEEMHQ